MSAAAFLHACPQRDGCPMVSPRDLRRLDLAPRLRTVTLAAAVSVLVHLSAMAAFAPRDTALVAGGGEDAPAALGTSFADFAQGTLAPSEAEPVVPDMTDALAPERTAQSVAPAPPAAQTTSQPPLAAPLGHEPETALLPVAPVQEDIPDTFHEQAIAAPSETAEQAVPPPEPMIPAQVSPDQFAADAKPDLILPERPDELALGTTTTELAPETSPAPPPRPNRTEPPRQARAPQGNAPQTATRGGQQTAQGQAASEAPARAQSTDQGNAAVSNYPGEVLRRIQRVRQARSPARGQVLVSFSIGPSGALASISLARSSGHTALDQTALDHIRRAAPFPPPPSGAQHQFSFEFVGR